MSLFSKKLLTASEENLIKEIKQRYNNLIKLNDQEFSQAVRDFNNFIRTRTTNKSDEEIELILDKNLRVAFAFAMAAIYKTKGIKLRETQILGAYYLNSGKVSEMKTGEGKTLTAVLPAYLNAITKKGVHIATPNQYLAERDYEETSKIFNLLGLSSSYVEEGITKNLNDSKRKSYSSDITYGSISTLAFDHMYDSIKPRKSDLVKSRENHYLIIDEADDIMIDSAVIPFIISDFYETEKLLKGEEYVSRKEERKNKEKLKRARAANEVVFNLFDHIKNIDRGLLYKTRNDEIFDDLAKNKISGLHLDVNDKNKRELLSKTALLYNENTSELVLTEKGLLFLSYTFQKERIEKLINSKSNLNTFFRRNIRRFKRGRDYTILKDGKINLNFGLYEKILDSKVFKNINKEAIEMLEFVFQNYGKEIDTSLNAYFNLKLGVDYLIENTDDLKKKKIALVIGGRKAESRSYGDGLQQAVELKENSFTKKYRNYKDVDIEITKDKEKVSVLTMASFLETYNKVSGMTGTAPEKSFDLIYGLDTKKIPKNSEYIEYKTGKVFPKRNDRESLVFLNDDYKVRYLIKEIKNSIKKGQPVLISTTSVSKSEEIAKIIEKVFPNKEINLLNANTKKEAMIIAQAGQSGKITIATEMAGRGTDIKLGGDYEKLIEAEFDQYINTKREEYLSLYERGLKNRGLTLSYAIRKHLIDKFNQEKLPKFKEIFEKQDFSNWKRRIENDKNRVLRSGGLKLVALSHFKSRRQDDQVRGRVARGGEPGETIFLSSVKDLEELGVKITDKEKKALRRRPLLEKNLKSSVEERQNTLENQKSTAIYHTNLEERFINDLRKISEHEHKKLRDSRNIKLEVKEKFNKVSDFIINECFDGERINKLKISKILYNDFNIDYDFRKLKDSEVKRKLIYVLKTRYDNLEKALGKNNFSKSSKAILMQSNFDFWDEFKLETDHLRNHMKIMTAGFKSEDEKTAFFIREVDNIYKDLKEKYDYNAIAYRMSKKDGRYLDYKKEKERGESYEGRTSKRRR